MVSRLSFALVAISLLVSNVVQCAPLPQNGKLLLTSTDGKHDDKMAMTYGEKKGFYDAHHVFINGVANTDATHHNIDDWNQWMEGAGHQGVPREYFRGSTPFKYADGSPMASSHEEIFEHQQAQELYQPERKSQLHDLDQLPGHLYQHAGKHADFVSMAPIPLEELLHLLQQFQDAGIILDSFHHIAGYNSRQDYASRRQPSAATNEFLKNLIHYVHGFYPHCHVFMTSSKFNFDKKDAGGTQNFADMVGMFPAHHLDQVGFLETFTQSQIQATKDALGDAFYPFYGADDHSPITQAEIWEARRNANPNSERTKKLRENILTAIAINMENLPERHNLKNRLPSVAQGIDKACQGEACDFNHVALLHNSLETGKPALQHIHVEDGINFRAAHPDGDDIHGLSPQLKKSNKAVTTRIMKNAFPIVDHPVFHENIHV